LVAGKTKKGVMVCRSIKRPYFWEGERRKREEVPIAPPLREGGAKMGRGRKTENIRKVCRKEGHWGETNCKVN